MSWLVLVVVLFFFSWVELRTPTQGARQMAASGSVPANALTP